MPQSPQTEARKAGKTTAKKTSAARAQDAIALLKADHREVEKLFRDFEKASGDSRKQQLARKISMELKVHTQIEEEIFYPHARVVLTDEEIINEAIAEHDAAKELIAEIEGMAPNDEMFDAKVKVLQEQIEHHVQEEEKELFPKLQKSEMDLKGVGEELKARKQELKRQMQGDRRATH